MDLTLTDFQGWRNATIQVKGFTVVLGESNRGKSSTARALKKVLRNEVTEGNIRLTTKETRVALSLEDHEVEVSRVRKGSATYVVDGAEFSKLGGAIPPVMGDWGYQPVEVNGVKVDPVFAGQFDAQFLLSSSPAETSAILNAFASTERLDKGRKTLKSRSSEIDAEAKVLGVQISGLEDQVADLAERKVQAESLRQQITEQMARVRDLHRVVKLTGGLHDAIVASRAVAEKVVAVDAARTSIAQTLTHLARLVTTCKLHLVIDQRAAVAQKLAALDDVEPRLDVAMKAYLRLERVLRIHGGIALRKRNEAVLEALGGLQAPLEETVRRYKVLVRIRALLLNDPAPLRARAEAVKDVTSDVTTVTTQLKQATALVKAAEASMQLRAITTELSSLQTTLDAANLEVRAAQQELDTQRRGAVTCPKCNHEFIPSHEDHHD